MLPSGIPDIDGSAFIGAYLLFIWISNLNRQVLIRESLLVDALGRSIIRDSDNSKTPSIAPIVLFVLQST
jgi:hypothetical protein